MFTSVNIRTSEKNNYIFQNKSIVRKLMLCCVSGKSFTVWRNRRQTNHTPASGPVTPWWPGHRWWLVVRTQRGLVLCVDMCEGTKNFAQFEVCHVSVKAKRADIQTPLLTREKKLNVTLTTWNFCFYPKTVFTSTQQSSVLTRQPFSSSHVNPMRKVTGERMETLIWSQEG